MSNCDQNCESVANLNDYAANLIEYSKRIDKWVNGGQTEFVDVGGVQTPTLRNLAMMIKALMGVHPDNKTIFINQDKEIYVNLRNIIQAGGGLNLDNDGRLFVDVASMNTEVFQELMQTIRVPIWLTGNTDFYVNQSHPDSGDSLVDGRGTINKPFATIQACINYVTNNFNMVGFNANIRIAAGTYNENLSLGTFSHTTGSIVLTTYPGQENQVNIIMGGRTGLSCSGSIYYANNLNFIMKPQYSESYWDIVSLVNIPEGGKIYFRACKFTMTDYSGATAPSFRSDMFFIFGGTLGLQPSLAGETQMSINFQKAGTHESFVFEAQQNGFIIGSPTNLNQAAATINCSGSHTAFIQLSRSNYTRNGGAIYMINLAGNMTGKRYKLIDGSSCLVSKNQNYFPGNEAGSVESSSYCWYE